MLGNDEQPARDCFHHQITVAVKPPYDWWRVGGQTWGKRLIRLQKINPVIRGGRYSALKRIPTTSSSGIAAFAF
ncbi:hypothetical protein ALQ43_200080 [Pseudomonas savastanoi pv. glycinea]|nr:hypothetical protein ALQ43_200080 [Pseudomonas savastanoi pv. glycinea]